jgi:hypothetical protein
MTLKQQEDAGNLKRKQWITVVGELALEDSMDLL